MITGLEHKTI